MRTSIWRGPDDRHWTGREDDATFDRAAGHWVHRLSPAVQDPATGRWAANPAGASIDVAGEPEQSGFAEVSADPLAEPRLARLHAAVAALLTDYHAVTGRPYPQAPELLIALEDVAALPDQLRRRGYGLARQAARSAGHRRRGR